MIFIHEWGCDIWYIISEQKDTKPFYYMTGFWIENTSGNYFVLSCTYPLRLIFWVKNKKIKAEIFGKINKNLKKILGVLTY